MRLSRPLLLLVLGLLTGNASTQGLQPSEALTKSVEGLERDIATVRRAVRPHLSATQLAIFEQIDFMVLPVREPGLTHATRRFDKRQIIVSAGDFAVIVEAATAVAGDGTVFPEGTAHKYLSYLATQLAIDRVRASVGASSPLRDISFIKFMKVSPSQLRDEFEKHGLRGKRNMTIASAVGYVLVHEIGHHVLGHMNRDPSQTTEDEADDFAAIVGTRMGYDPFLGHSYLLLMGAYQGADNRNSDHSSPGCRTARLRATGGRVLLSDARRVGVLRELGELANVSKAVADAELKLSKCR